MFDFISILSGTLTVVKKIKHDTTERDESKLRNIFTGLINMQMESDEFILQRQTQQVNGTSDFNTRDDYNLIHVCIIVTIMTKVF